nr:hypothetical protein [Tanacetum cinerariifolium]
MFRLWLIILKGSDPLGQNGFSRIRRMREGFLSKNKARLVAQGHTQEEGIDYNEVFAPVARIKAIILFLAYSSFMGFTVYQMDVKSTFLYGTIDEEVEFKALMHCKFQMSSMGELNFFLVLQVLQKEDGIFLSQDKSVGDILKKFIYSDVRSSNTLIDKENPWGKDGTGKDVDLHLYISMIGSLMYLTASRPDIMFAVCTCARHQVTPKECHLHAVKRIFRYLKGHPKLWLWYLKESPFDLVAYSDSDYGVATQDRKSTTGRFLGTRLSMPCEALLREISSSILHLLHTAKTFDLVWMWLGGDYGNVFLMGFNGIQWIETTEEGTKILATVDGILITITESSLRRNLKLQNEEGISSLPDTELFENLTLMGYNISPNQKIVPLFDIMLVSRGEGSGTPTEPNHTPSLEAHQTSHTTYSSPTLPPITTASIPTVIPSETTPLRQYTRRARIAQSSALLPVVDEHASPLKDVSKGEACPTDSGFGADQDKANIAKTSTLPHDSAPRVTSPAADEGRMGNPVNDVLAKNVEVVLAKDIVIFVDIIRILYMILQQEEKRIEEEQAANARYWRIPSCCDDDDDYDSAITPVLSIEEPNIEYVEASPHDSELVSLEEAEIVIPEVEEIEDDNLC